MLDIGWSEILVVAIVAILVVGPKELPGMLRTFGRAMTKLRSMANEFRGQFEEALKEADLDDVRKGLSSVQKLNPVNTLRDAIDPLRQMGKDIKTDIQKATKVDPPAEKPAVAPAAETSAVAAAPATKPTDTAEAAAPTILPPKDAAVTADNARPDATTSKKPASSAKVKAKKAATEVATASPKKVPATIPAKAVVVKPAGDKAIVAKPESAKTAIANPPIAKPAAVAEKAAPTKTTKKPVKKPAKTGEA